MVPRRSRSAAGGLLRASGSGCVVAGRRSGGARRAATEYIDTLTEGYDNPVGDLGAKLSGGQKQRAALPRALIREPEVLILDEATSALDVQSEKSIQDAIFSLRKRITVIVIARRLTTVERADRIFVIKDGRVAESGNFQELKKRGGEFAKLHSLGR